MPSVSWTVQPIHGAALGAMVTDVDLNHVPASLVPELPRLLAEHGVLVFRGQQLSADAVMAVAGLLGSVEESVMDQFAKPGYPRIYTLSNIVENGRPIGASTDGYGWHSDQGYFEHPTAYTLLYGVETPEQGADTVFADTRCAWESLPPAQRQRLRDVRTRHSYEQMLSDRRQKPEFAGKVPSLTEQQRQRVPEVVHPLVRRHPLTGALGLYLGGQTLIEMIGMDLEEGRALTKALFALCTSERFQYRHAWQPGDLVVWDNRHTMHRATPYDKERYRRLLWRLSVRGERPLGADAAAPAEVASSEVAA